MQNPKVAKFKEKYGQGGVLMVMLIALALYLIYPAVGYFGGWVIGHICSWLWGDILIDGINALFKTGFSAEALPMIFGTLSMIASFFNENALNVDALTDDDEEEEDEDVLEGN